MVKLNIKTILKIITFAVVSELISTPLQIFNSIFVLHERNRPETAFLISIAIIGTIMKILFAVAFINIGKFLPIKNSILKGLSFIGLVWISAYFPQIMGLVGGDGPIIEKAFSISIFLCDTIVYIINGIILGILFKSKYYSLKKCNNISLVKTIITNAILFPVLTFLTEQLLGKINNSFFIIKSLQVAKAKSFILSFYGFLIITGIMLPIFYRLTNYNEVENKAFKFGLFFSICLWSPIVAIMIAFGTNIKITCLYVITFFIIIMLITRVNVKMLNNEK